MLRPRMIRGIRVAGASWARSGVGSTRSLMLHAKRYQRHGTTAQEPVLYLHGLMGNATSLGMLARDEDVNHFADSVAVDMRNHGSSPHSASMEWVDVAGDIIETMDSVFGRGAVFNVVGHSLGGKVAVALACLHPSRVQSICAIDVAPATYTWDDSDILSVRNVMRVISTTDPTIFQNRAEATRALLEHIPNEAIVHFVAQNLVFARDTTGKRRLKWRLNIEALEEQMSVMGGFFDPPHMPLDTPATFIAGGRSAYLEDRHHALIHSFFRDALIHTIPGAGHWVHAEKPQIVKDLVMDHLALHG